MFKFTLRALWRDRTYTALNLLGLATGLAAALLVLLWVQDELTFDRSHKQGKNIVRVLTNWDFGGERQWTAVTPAGLVPAAKTELPEVQEATRVWRFGASTTFKVGPTLLEAGNAIIVDNSFFDVFDFPLLRSDGSKPLSTPNGILLTETLARKFFADADPLGKTIRFNDRVDVVVTGILKDPPSNSSIQFSCILPWEPIANQVVRDPKNAFHWGQMSFVSWFLLRPEADREALAHKLAALVARYRNDPEYAPFWYALQPLNQVYLDSDMLAHDAGTGDRKTIAVFGFIGLLVLVIACINYINLATARASIRAKEVGVRKVIGAGRGELFGQFLAESGVLILAATGLAMLFAMAALPLFNELSGKNFHTAQFFQPVALRVVGATAAFALILAGVYPALLLTRFNPAAVLRGQMFNFGGSGNSGAVLRKTLVTSQFVFSLVLITGAFIIARQMAFVREVKLGYEPQQVFSMAMYGSESPANVVKNDLVGKPGIAAVSTTNNPFINLGSQNGGMDWEGKPDGKKMPVWQLDVDTDVATFFGLELVEGRWFRPEMNGYDSTSFLINETAAREMGLLGQATGKWVNFDGVKGSIAGVLKDFNFQSLHEKIEPLIFFQNPEWLDIVYIKTAPGKTTEAIASAQATFEKFNPGKIFKYKFADEEYDQLYKTEARVGSLFNLFAGLAVVISCLGLLGLVTFAAQHRAKEIGIRKVLGASIASVVGLLAKDFLRLVVIAVVISSPVAYYLMKKWLADFAYRIDLQWWMFAVAGVLAVGVAFLTVSSQAVRAALANPVKSLRSE